MSSWRRFALPALIVWCAVVVTLCFMPWRAVAPLTVPTGAPAKSVSVTCGPAFGADYLHAPVGVASRINGNPCNERQSVKIIGVSDVGITVVILVAVFAFRRRRTAEVVAPLPSA